MRLINFLFFFGFVNIIIAQDVEFEVLSQTKTCSGTIVEIEYTYIPKATSVSEFNFNDKNLPNGWYSSDFTFDTPCSLPDGPSPDGSIYFWATSYSATDTLFPNERYVKIAPVNVENGGTIEGLIRYGADDPSVDCEDPDLSNEEVYLKYSIDGGLTYNVIYGGWDTDPNKGKDWYKWDEFSITIPPGAQTTSTIFLFHQEDNSDTMYDNWGLEDIVILAIPPDPTIYKFDYLTVTSTTNITSSHTLVETILFPPSDSNVDYDIDIEITLENSTIFTKSVSFTAISSDHTKPDINAPNPLSLNTDPGRCYAGSVDLGVPIVTDNCGIHSIQNDAPERFTPGTTLVTWVVSDTVGNISTAVQTVTVIDNENPQITAPPPINSSNCNVELGLPIVTDNCAIHSYINDAPGVFPTGVTTITWTVSDTYGNISSALQTVTIIDNVKPSIIAPINLNIDTDPGRCYAGSVDLGEPVVSDNCNIHSYSNNAPDRFLTGVTTVTWTVSDTSGNVSTSIQLVTVTDNELPISNISNTLSSECVVIIPAAYTDNCGIFQVTNDAPAEFPAGLTTITWEIEDINDNKIIIESTVTISDTTNPVIISPNDIEINVDPGSCFATGLFLLGNPITSDNCDVDQVTNNAPVNFPIGVTTITWTVSDTAGNISTDNQRITVIDNENPLITAPGNVTVNTDPGLCSASGVVLGVPVTSDN
ncbi:HYR domain-containing protein, partial [archaeon]|nr:HYR domain-containing protein [archaeon]